MDNMWTTTPNITRQRHSHNLSTSYQHSYPHSVHVEDNECYTLTELIHISTLLINIPIHINAVENNKSVLTFVDNFEKTP